jgi:Tol biopolymer transport system component
MSATRLAVVMILTVCWTVGAWGQEAGVNTQGGIWVGRWENEAVVGKTIRHVSPEGRFFQSMMHPEGTKVVFWGRAPGEGSFDIWVANVDGTGVRKVTTDQAANEAPFWTPDGRIVWASRRGGEERPRLWVMNEDGTNARQVTSGAGAFGDVRPCVSPDGSTVVFESTRAGGRESKLWRVPLSGGTPVQVTRHAGADRRPVFSHDGKRLAYFTTGSATGSFNLAVMEWPDGKPVQPVTIQGRDNLRGPFWRRDGKRVAVHGRLGGSLSVRLYVVEVETGKWQEVQVPGSRSSGHASWDRREKWITFDGARDVPNTHASSVVRLP